MTTNAFDLLIVPLCQGLASIFVAAAMARGLIILAISLLARPGREKGAGPAPGPLNRSAGRQLEAGARRTPDGSSKRPERSSPLRPVSLDPATANVVTTR
jgi:hypothetical protein